MNFKQDKWKAPNRSTSASACEFMPWLRLEEGDHLGIDTNANAVFQQEHGYIAILSVCGIDRSGNLSLMNALLDQQVVSFWDGASSAASDVEVFPCLFPTSQIVDHASSSSEKVGFINAEYRTNKCIKEAVKVSTPILIISKVIILNEVCSAGLAEEVILAKLRVMMHAAQCITSKLPVFGCLHIVLQDCSESEEECKRIIFADEHAVETDSDEQVEAMQERNKIRAVVRSVFESFRVWCLPKVGPPMGAQNGSEDSGPRDAEKIRALRLEIDSQLAEPKLLNGYPLTGSMIATLAPQVAEAMNVEQPMIHLPSLMEDVLSAETAIIANDVMELARRELDSISKDLPMSSSKLLHQAQMVRNCLAMELEGPIGKKAGALFMQEFDDGLTELIAQNHHALTKLVREVEHDLTARVSDQLQALTLPMNPEEMQMLSKHLQEHLNAELSARLQNAPVSMVKAAQQRIIGRAEQALKHTTPQPQESTSGLEIDATQSGKQLPDLWYGSDADASKSVPQSFDGNESASRQSPTRDDSYGIVFKYATTSFGQPEQLGELISNAESSARLLEHMVTQEEEQCSDHTSSLAKSSEELEKCNLNLQSKAAAADPAFELQRSDRSTRMLSGGSSAYRQHVGTDEDPGLMLSGSISITSSPPCHSDLLRSFPESEPGSIRGHFDELEVYDDFGDDELGLISKAGTTHASNEFDVAHDCGITPVTDPMAALIFEDDGMPTHDGPMSMPTLFPLYQDSHHQVKHQVHGDEAVPAAGPQATESFAEPECMLCTEEESYKISECSLPGSSAIWRSCSTTGVSPALRPNIEIVANEFEEQRCTPQSPFWTVQGPVPYSKCGFASQTSKFCVCLHDSGKVVSETEISPVHLKSEVRSDYRDFLTDVAEGDGVESLFMLHDVEADPPEYSRPPSAYQVGHPSKWQHRSEVRNINEISLPYAAKASDFASRVDKYTKHVEAAPHLPTGTGSGVKQHPCTPVPEDNIFLEHSWSAGCCTSVLASADGLFHGPVQQPRSFADKVDDDPIFGDDINVIKKSSAHNNKDTARIQVPLKMSL